MDTEATVQKTYPSKFLSNIIGSSVIVKLNNGLEYSGNLQSIDGYMNVVLDKSKEMMHGKEIRAYEDVFIRGNNGKYIAAFYETWGVLQHC